MTSTESTPPLARPADEPPTYLRPTGRYTARFVLVYSGLATVLVGAIVGLAVVLIGWSGFGSGPSKSWSGWSPAKSTTGKMTASIAQHVANRYHLNKSGGPLLAAVSNPPQVANGTTKVEVSHVVLRKTASKNSTIVVNPTGATWSYNLCGLGTGCSIASGQPTYTRGQLVRREALELALYTFKFVPGIDTVVAFMPPPAGSPPSTLLYLQKANLKAELSQPLDKTLPLAKPPLPTVADSTESATIDKLTLPATYNYTVQGLQDDSAVLILTPLKS